MKFKYKSLMFLTLFVFCIGSVCATDPNDNIDSDSKVKQIPLEKFKLGKQVTEKMRDRVKDLNRVVTDQGAEIKKFKLDNIELNKTITNQSVEIQKLKESNIRLEESNKKQDFEIQEHKKEIQEHKTRIQNLEDKLNDRDSEIKRLNEEKDKLHEEITQTYKKLLDSPKIEDFNQLKKQIDDKDKQN